MKYRKDLTVDIHDVDFNGVARLSSLMRYIQSAAQTQLSDNGMSYNALKEMHKAFILSKIKMEFTEAVGAHEPLVATTFPCESRGYSFYRCYTLEKDGRLIGRAVSVWALVDTESHALVRVNNFDLGLTTHTPLELQLNRFNIPEDVKEVGKYRINYDDTDQNMHMNNTKYPDMYSNFLNLKGKRIHTISINYLKEAPMGEELTVFLGKGENGAYYFRTEREDGEVNTEAEIWLTEI